LIIFSLVLFDEGMTLIICFLDEFDLFFRELLSIYI